MSFQICYCGNTSDPHYFRHSYTETATVIRCIEGTEENSKEYFILDADSFPLKTRMICAKPNCTFSPVLHQTNITPHAFEPYEQSYREINFVLPQDTKCRSDWCLFLKEHEHITSHRFVTKVMILNQRKHDIVRITNPNDSDIPIVWKDPESLV